MHLLQLWFILIYCQTKAKRHRTISPIFVGLLIRFLHHMLKLFGRVFTVLVTTQLLVWLAVMNALLHIGSEQASYTWYLYITFPIGIQLH